MSNKHDNTSQLFKNALKDLQDKGTYIISVDYGHSYTKSAMYDYSGDILKTASFPTVFKTTKATSTLQEIEFDYLVEYKDMYYAVGERAAYNDGVRKWNKEQSLIVDDFAIILASAFHELTQDIATDIDKLNIFLVVGLPYDYYDTQKDRLIDMLKGLNIVANVNGKGKKSYIINEIEVMQQGAGAFYNYIFDDFGAMKKPVIDWIKEENGIALSFLDFGYRTLEYISVFYNVKKDKIWMFGEKSGSINKGLNDSHKLTQNELNQALDKTEEVLFYELALNDNNGLLNIGRSKVDINEYFDKHYKTWVTEVFDELVKRIDLNTSRKVILTGGSAGKLSEFIPERFSDINFELQDNGFLANAKGYLSKYNSMIALGLLVKAESNKGKNDKPTEENSKI